jgi:hypothetical protein
VLILNIKGGYFRATKCDASKVRQSGWFCGEPECAVGKNRSGDVGLMKEKSMSSNGTIIFVASLQTKVSAHNGMQLFNENLYECCYVIFGLNPVGE